MFFCLSLFKINQPYPEKINGNGNIRMAFDLFPGFLHTLTPVNIIKNKNGVFMYLWQTPVKIIQRSILTVISVNIDKIQLRETFNYTAQ